MPVKKLSFCLQYICLDTEINVCLDGESLGRASISLLRYLVKGSFSFTAFPYKWRWHARAMKFISIHFLPYRHISMESLLQLPEPPVQGGKTTWQMSLFAKISSTTTNAHLYTDASTKMNRNDTAGKNYDPQKWTTNWFFAICQVTQKFQN